MKRVGLLLQMRMLDSRCEDKVERKVPRQSENLLGWRALKRVM